MQLFLQHLPLSLVYNVTFQNRNSELLGRIIAAVILLFAFEHFRHAEIKTNQKLSTMTSSAAAPHFRQTDNGSFSPATSVFSYETFFHE
jgi:hypothetical protein